MSEDLSVALAAPPRVSRTVTPLLLLTALSVAMTQTIVVAALPVFQRTLAASPSDAAWLLTAFMLAAAVATPIAGRAGDLYGYRPVLIACLLCLAAGSVLAALADDAGRFNGLLAGRVLQGVSGGAFPMLFGIARTWIGPTRVRGVVAALSAMFGVGGALGLVVAGPLTSGLGTAWLFWLPAILALLCLSGIIRLPGSANRRSVGSRAVDVPGAVLLSGAMVCLLLAISQGRTWGWASTGIIGLCFGAAALAAAFTWVQTKVAVPLVDLRLLRHRPLATTNVATVVTSVAMFAAVTLIPQFVQTPAMAGYGFGISPARTGVVVIPMAALMLLAGPSAARIGARFGARVPLQTGAILAAVAFGLLATVHTHLWQFYLAGAILGAGYGLAFASLGNLIVDAVPPDQTGAATGVNTILRTVGGAIGAQIAAAILADSVPRGSTLPTEVGYTSAFVTFALIALGALVSTRLIPAATPTAGPVP